MAISEAEKDADEAEEGAAAPARKRVLSLRMALTVTGIVLLGGVSLGTAYTLGWLEDDQPAQQMRPAMHYYPLPEFTVNLSGNEDRPQYLRMKIALEASDRAAIDAVEPRLPRIVDIFQVYLRELRPSDLEGSAGLYRLREELVRRVNMTIAPRAVEDVLFQEVLIQ